MSFVRRTGQTDRVVHLPLIHVRVRPEPLLKINPTRRHFLDNTLPDLTHLCLTHLFTTTVWRRRFPPCQTNDSWPV